MDPSISLIIAIASILFLIRLKVNISFSIFIGAIILGFLTLGIKSVIQILIIISSLNTLRIVSIVILAFTLGYSMEYFGLLKRLASATQRMFGSFSVAILPALFGFLPMPGGALISAVMIKDLVKEYEITPETATYINYWFRHLWVAIWPLYPSLIIAIAIVDVNFVKVVEADYIIAIAAILAGLYFIKDLSLKFKWSIDELKHILISTYPIVVVALLGLVLKLDLLLTLLISIFLLYIHKKPKLSDFTSIFKKTIDLKLILLVMAVMSFRGLIEETNAALTLFDHLNDVNIPIALAAFILSFTIGFATGIEMSYTSIALPLLTIFTGISSSFNAANFMLVFAAGYLGVMISPLHLCLVLTNEYYQSEIRGVYKKLIPSALVLATIVLVYYVLVS